MQFTTEIITREEAVKALGEDVVARAEGKEPQEPMVLELILEN